VYTFVLRAEIDTIFGPNVVVISARNSKVYKICELCKAIFSAFYNISQPNFAYLREEGVHQCLWRMGAVFIGEALIFLSLISLFNITHRQGACDNRAYPRGGGGGGVNREVNIPRFRGTGTSSVILFY
jgi:hypothetical protein